MKTKTNSPFSAIKLYAQHHSHINVISAHMQDAVISSSSFIHEPDKKTFKLMGNRFCWEKFLNPTDPIKVRVNAGLHFDHVNTVQKKNIHLHHPEKLHNLMSMEASDTEVLLHFSGGCEIRLEVEKISCKMADLHEPYPTQFFPGHSAKEK